MKSKILLPSILLLFIFQTKLFAQFSKKDLLSYSKNFIVKQQLSKKNLEPFAVIPLKDNHITYAYVVTLKPKGFLVFSSSEKLSPILSFSTESNFDFKNSNENILLSMIKDDTKRDLTTLKKKLTRKQLKTIARNKTAWERLKPDYTSLKKKYTKATLHQYGPHLSSVWGGVNCYDIDSVLINVGNHYTPNNYSPGCVATTLSIALRYYQWPETGVGSHTNVDNRGSSRTTNTANFGNTTYDYANMLDEYMGTTSNLAQQQAMGYLAYHCGTALDMDYEAHGSTSNINRIPAASGSYFRFSGHHKYYSWANFWPRMQQNLENGHPVPLSVYASNGAGHAPITDGIMYFTGDAQSDYFYHLNMGWYGVSNAWYKLQGSFNASGYNSVNAAVFDLLPEPAFTQNTMDASSKTFTLQWKTSPTLNWDAFELQESTDNGATYTTIDNTITDTSYTRTVATGGTYKYRVRTKIDGHYYLKSYSTPITVTVPNDYVYLDFDGNDSFFIYENSANDFDISTTYTIESWIKIDHRTSGTYPVILDRKTVFSLFLIADSNADYAVKFVARSTSGNSIASVQSNNTSENLSYNEWVHVAVSRANGVLKLFINGTAVASSTDPDFSLSASSKALNIGARYWGGYSRYLNGKIDNIRITDNAIYTSNFTPNLSEKYTPNSHTRILLALDEGTGTSLTDDTGNFNTVLLRSSPHQPNWMFGDDNGVKNTTQATVITQTSKLYPNPATSSINLPIHVQTTQKGSLKIYNYVGQLVLSKTVTISKETATLQTDISKLETGLYYMNLRVNNKDLKATFIKK